MLLQHKHAVENEYPFSFASASFLISHIWLTLSSWLASSLALDQVACISSSDKISLNYPAEFGLSQ